jgi:hypothetical protein
MKQSLLLTIASLLSILFMTFHFTDDTLHAKAGTPEALGATLYAVPILVVWLYGTLVLAERRSGHIIMLIGSLLGLLMPAVHMMMAETGIIGSGGVGRGYLFVWTLHALGVTAMFSLILAVRGLWSLRRGQPR